MSSEEILTTVTELTAASLAASQYRFVVLGTTGVQRNTTNAGDCFGINQGNETVVGSASSIAIAGRSKVVLGAALTAGTKVMSDNQGRAIAATGTGAYILGTLTEGGAADEVGNMILEKSGQLN